MHETHSQQPTKNVASTELDNFVFMKFTTPKKKREKKKAREVYYSFMFWVCLEAWPLFDYVKYYNVSLVILGCEIKFVILLPSL